MSIWKTYDLPLSEFSLGNIFYHYGVDRVMITGIHTSGRIQVANEFSREVQELESYKELKPIELPTGASDFWFEDMLLPTEFRKRDSGYYQMFFNGGSIKMVKQMQNEQWILMYENPITNEHIIRPVKFLHEFQNAFTSITKSKLSLL